MFRVEIPSVDMMTRNVASRRGMIQFREQEAYLHMAGKPYPERIVISLRKDQAPYSPGWYVIDMQRSLYVDRFRKLSFSLELQPAAPAIPESAA